MARKFIGLNRDAKDGADIVRAAAAEVARERARDWIDADDDEVAVRIARFVSRAEREYLGLYVLKHLLPSAPEVPEGEDQEAPPRP